MSNKKAKTKKVVRRRLNIKGVFLLVVALALICLAGYWVWNMKVSNIYIEGNKYVSTKQIIAASKLSRNAKYFSLNSSICQKIKENPIIDTCKVRHKLNWQIKIEITENRPILYYNSTKKIVLENGSEMDGTNEFGVPSLINYTPEKILKKFITGLAAIESDIIHSISEIEYAPSANSQGVYIDEERFILSMNDGNTVYVNNRHLDVLSYYEKIYASIGDRVGTYYLDCDFNNYYFEEYSAEAPDAGESNPSSEDTDTEGE